MKKNLLILVTILIYGSGNAQNLLFDNGPLVDLPGAGFGGADVSSLHDGINILGYNHSAVLGYKVAEDFTVPLAGWTVDSFVFFAYQTNATISSSSINEIRMGIYDGSPALNGNLIYGDTTLDALSYTYWSGIYRTTDLVYTAVNRPIMRNIVETPALVLAAGTYFVSWSTGGFLTSGPWAPPINLGTPNVVTGDAIQFVGKPAPNLTGIWQPVKDSSSTTGAGSQALNGLPFQVYGHLTTVGINEIKNGEFGITKVYPVPASDHVKINYTAKENSTLVFSLKDNLGRELFSQEKAVVRGENPISFDLSKFQSGLYFISARGSETFNVVKFVKE